MVAITRLGLYGGSRSLYGSFAGKVEQVIEELVGGVKARKIKFKDIEPVWKQKDQLVDSVDLQVVRELKKSLKQHKPDIIDVKGEVEAQIRAIYHNQEVKKVIKKRKKQKALALILMEM